MIFKDLDDLCSYARKIGKGNLPITVNIRNKLTERIYKRRGSFVDKYYKHGIVFVVYPAEDIIDSFEIEWFKDGSTATFFCPDGCGSYCLYCFYFLYLDIVLSDPHNCCPTASHFVCQLYFSKSTIRRNCKGSK